jgi:hypothetical protein
MAETPLDDDLVAVVLDNLKDHPSEVLREMVARSDGDEWSPEALEAARLLLDRRSKGTAPEPDYQTAPRAGGVGQAQPPRELQAGDAVLAPALGGRAQLYPGVIGESRGDSVYIYFDNGDRRWVALADVHPLDIDVGTRLHHPLRGAGTVIGRQGERLFLRYDGGGGEWLTLAQIVASSGRGPSFLERSCGAYARFTEFLKKLILGR